MTQAAAATGSGPVTLVAVEQYFPADQRIIYDELAYHILPFRMRAFVRSMQFTWARNWMERQTEKSAPGIWGGMMGRKRYIDEKLIESLGTAKAVVNLGAGFDTRVYRLPGVAAVPAWEVDQPVNIEEKRKRLQKLFGGIPAHVTLVPIDFDYQELAAELAGRGYANDQPTFFILEAVTQYLTEAGIQSTFGFMAKAARGSRMCFTYIRRDFLDGEKMYGQEALYRDYVGKNKTWLFGLAPERVADFLGAHGWEILDHVGGEEFDERYVKPAGRSLATTPIERMVYGEKT